MCFSRFSDGDLEDEFLCPFEKEERKSTSIFSSFGTYFLSGNCLIVIEIGLTWRPSMPHFLTTRIFQCGPVELQSEINRGERLLSFARGRKKETIIPSPNAISQSEKNSKHLSPN